jgi:hypothetical protein
MRTFKTESSIAAAALCFLFLFGGLDDVSAQHGGKAEPLRIHFAAGRTSMTLTGRLSNDQEMEYIFAAQKGQRVTIRNTHTSLFDFRVFKKDADFDTEFDSSRSSTIDLPESGDYMLYVRKKRVRTPRTARFTLTLTIR